MKDLSSILQDFLKRKGWSDKLFAYKSLDVYNKEIREEFPELKASLAEDISEGVLRITVESSVMNYEINLRKREIIERINRILGNKVVSNIAVRLGRKSYE